MPAYQPPPKADPLPSPTPTESESMQNAEDRRKKIAALRYGLASTIKAGSATGASGTGPELNTQPTGGLKKTMGS